jgi:hypothetical protein
LRTAYYLIAEALLRGKRIIIYGSVATGLAPDHPDKRSARQVLEDAAYGSLARDSELFRPAPRWLGNNTEPDVAESLKHGETDGPVPLNDNGSHLRDTGWVTPFFEQSKKDMTQ